MLKAAKGEISDEELEREVGKLNAEAEQKKTANAQETVSEQASEADKKEDQTQKEADRNADGGDGDR